MKLPLFSTLFLFLLSLSSSCHASQQRLLQKRAFGLLQKHGSRAAQTAAAGRTSVANVVTASSNVATLPFVGTAAKQSLQSSKGFLTFSHRATRLQQQLQRSYSLRAIFLDAITNKPESRRRSSSATTTTTAMHGEELHSMMRPQPLWQDVQRIAGGTVAESWNGFVGGYLLATGLDVTKRLYWKVIATSLKPSGLAVATSSPTVAAASSLHQLPYPGLRAFSQETLWMHARSRQFGVEWAQMSAVFCASRGLVKALRQRRQQQQQAAAVTVVNGDTALTMMTHQPESTYQQQQHQHALDDEWDTVLGGGVAGAAFSALARKGPVAMARGALLYGTTMFVLHPHLWKSGMQAAMLAPPPKMIDGVVEATRPNNPLDWLDGME